MADKDNRRLVEAILDYMRWVKSVHKDRANGTSRRYNRILIDFIIFGIKGSSLLLALITESMYCVILPVTFSFSIEYS